jgi:prepilin-type N-terminal cleavage/methylation domain-containing protein
MFGPFRGDVTDRKSLRHFDAGGHRCAGFTLMELLVSLAVFLVISAAVLGSMMDAQRRHRSEELHASLQDKMRAAMEMMVQEIGQAGLPASGVDVNGLAEPIANIVHPSAALNPGADQVLTVDSVSGLYPNEFVYVDNGSSQEFQQITAISTSGTAPQITLDLNQKHSANNSAGSCCAATPLYALGTIPGGILPLTDPVDSAPPTPGQSSQYQLELWGDLAGNGKSLIFVKYACPTAYPGNFTRQQWDVQTGTPQTAAPVVLLDNVIDCKFTYPDPSTLHTTSVGGGTQMVTSVGISLTIQSQTKDPVTGNYVTLKKSLLTIQPRNIIAADQQNQSGYTQELQPNPTSGIFANLP